MGRRSQHTKNGEKRQIECGGEGMWRRGMNGGDGWKSRAN
jgi:hypothetical protein